ncbi:LysR family transcriptional regulator [Amphritea japonica]|uniref:LysR family transcriptional regulator n=1 Tax=Amphritea japonica ATCC BAA-1530 TaxID=1278309 RepID=A0A7R6PPG7_9GAMM|nr:LysR family transcriptional regulator [Amphritea japonica]BBB27118.1 LysR family transcriptional regulator [Amphritea japonica ATCC BAA-1530]
MKWNDIRFILAIANHGTLHEAAINLKVNHSTVWRRIQSLEKTFSTQIFLVDRNGYKLTEAGENVIEHAIAMSANMDAIERVISGQNKELKGLIKLTAPAIIADGILPKLIKEFRKEHPEITFELLVESASLSLDKREADIAFRSTNNIPDNAIAHELGVTCWSLMIKKELYQGEKLTLEELKKWPMIGYINFDPTAAQWFEATFKESIKVVSCNDVSHALTCAREGLGVALLPIPYESSLTCLYKLPSHFDIKMWLLTHRDLRTSARIKAFWDFILKKHKESNILKMAINSLTDIR